MKTTVKFLISSMVFAYYAAIAANPSFSTFASGFLHPKDWGFEENLGQLADPSGNALPEIKYFGSFAGAQVYCTSQKLSFVFTKTTLMQVTAIAAKKPQVKLAPMPKYTTSASRVDLEFEGANTDVTIVSSNKQDRTVNYATAHTGGSGITGVGFYKTLTYINLYNHIDMVVSANTTGLEYEFIVHPGGNVQDINLVRNGTDNMEMLANGGIKYTTAFGTLEESKPKSYSASANVSSSFIRHGNKLSFKTEVYDHNKDLIIDPGIVWATYFGGDSSDGAYSIALDPSGDIYIAGYTNSPKGIATKGAYQTSLAGGVNFDVLVAKFTNSGSLIWATYFGGDSDDYAQGCALDNSGNLYVTGYTLSPTGMATKGAYQTSLAGPYGLYDAFLAKFNSSGGLNWSTYFGGSIDDYGYSVAVDGNDNAYMYGFTGSSSGIATKGSFQTSYGGGMYDAYIAKFNGSGSLTWATYFGGYGQTQGTGIALDDAKNIYITGLTLSPNEIATKGAYKSTVDSINGNAFLACLDSNGFQKWGTYFGGNGGEDIGYAVVTNGKDKVYFTGNTGNTSGIATSGAYQSLFGGSSDVFLADFNTTGTINWATYYGGDADDYGLGISCDTSGNIYITGYTASDNQIATNGAYQTSIASTYGNNAFLARFNSNGALKYGTYFGGSENEAGYGVANDNAGDIYIDGISQSPGLATSGAYQSKNNGLTNTFIAKFLICDLATSFSGPTTTCGNSVTSYVALSHPNSTYLWTVSGGTIASGSYTDSITVKWPGSGSGSVSEEEINSLTGCMDNESLNVTIAPLPVPVITGDTVVCPLTSTSYHISPVSGVSYSWNVTPATIGSITTAGGKDSIEVFWISPGNSSVSINESSAGGACKSGDTVNVTVAATPIAEVKISDNGAGLLKFTCQDSSLNMADYNWVINGSKYDGYNVRDLFAHNGSYNVTLTVTNSAGCTASFDSTFTVSDAGISQSKSSSINWGIFPNPFKDQAEIQYSVTNPGPVEITVSDMLGRNIAVLENKTLQPGNYVNILDGEALNLNEGVYFVTMRANGGIETQRIVRVKN